MLNSAKTSFLALKRNILFFALINFVVYVALFMIFRYLNLLHLSGLRMLNYFTLGLISCYQTYRLIKNNGPLPFLQSFFTTLFTGSFSFLFFAVFIFLYAKTDPYFTGLYFNDFDGTIKLVPFIIIFFEGSAGSIIVGMITMMFSENNKGTG